MDLWLSACLPVCLPYGHATENEVHAHARPHNVLRLTSSYDTIHVQCHVVRMIVLHTICGDQAYSVMAIHAHYYGNTHVVVGNL